MTKEDFFDWCDESGYIRVNDWQYNIIKDVHYYFIINPKTDKFALIRFIPSRLGFGCTNQFDVLVQDWIDYNGWAEKFHEETRGHYK